MVQVDQYPVFLFDSVHIVIWNYQPYMILALHPP